MIEGPDLVPGWLYVCYSEGQIVPKVYVERDDGTMGLLMASNDFAWFPDGTPLFFYARERHLTTRGFPYTKYTFLTALGRKVTHSTLSDLPLFPVVTVRRWREIHGLPVDEDQ